MESDAAVVGEALTDERRWQDLAPSLWQRMKDADPAIRDELMRAWDERDKALAEVDRLRARIAAYEAEQSRCTHEQELADVLGDVGNRQGWAWLLAVTRTRSDYALREANRPEAEQTTSDLDEPDDLDHAVMEELVYAAQCTYCGYNDGSGDDGFPAFALIKVGDAWTAVCAQHTQAAAAGEMERNWGVVSDELD